MTGPGPGPAVALLYTDDAYRERTGPPAPPGGPGPQGLMGRQVAGHGFLDAYLTHGTWTELVALVRDRGSARAIERLFHEHPAPRARAGALRIVAEAELPDRLVPHPPATVIHSPAPPEAGYAWMRQQAGPGSFALSGVTHTLGSSGAVGMLRDLVIAPFEPYDALVCTSRAVSDMVRQVTGSFADYLRDRFGGSPAPAVPLVTIPLGVDTDRYRPASPEERAERRAALGIGDEDVAILFVGRLSHHAKAHPFPMFRGASLAARASGKTVHLILSGWFSGPAVRDAYLAGAREFAPGVRVVLVDGSRPEARFSVWHAADLFLSLSDSIQETFGLAVVEAMACGLPVVASDWDGYRDLVRDGETGFLVPTAMVSGGTADATARLLFGAVDYDRFLAECNQVVAVDVASTGEALARLAADESLRRRLGEAGRRRALNHFAWPHVIRAYEELWRNQEAERRARRGETSTRWAGAEGPAAYPSPERSFAGYPTTCVGPSHRVETVAGAEGRVATLLETPLVHYGMGRRVADIPVLLTVLEAARCGCAVADIDELFRRAGASPRAARATLGWMLKYELLRLVDDSRPG